MYFGYLLYFFMYFGYLFGSMNLIVCSIINFSTRSSYVHQLDCYGHSQFITLFHLVYCCYLRRSTVHYFYFVRNLIVPFENQMNPYAQLEERILIEVEKVVSLQSIANSRLSPNYIAFLAYISYCCQPQGSSTNQIEEWLAFVSYCVRVHCLKWYLALRRTGHTDSIIFITTEPTTDQLITDQLLLITLIRHSGILGCQ